MSVSWGSDYRKGQQLDDDELSDLFARIPKRQIVTAPTVTPTKRDWIDWLLIGIFTLLLVAVYTVATEWNW